jgi:penicillin-binding protein 1A
LGEALPDPDDFPDPQLSETSVVLDADGRVVAELSGAERRRSVGSDEISPYLKDAVVAIEDRRFYRHSGLDFRGILRAAAVNAVSGGVREGGSTLTQQLMKNRHVDAERRDDPSLTRKWFEGALAWRYEEEHTKREILTDYLNTVYFGAGAYGAEAASRTYFSKPADDLSLPEAATLAGIVNLPGAYDPFDDPEPVLKRRNAVLDAMLETGYLDPEEHRRAREVPLEVRPGSRPRVPEELAPYVGAVEAELARDYGERELARGGLVVRTALELGLQAAAAKAADETVDPEEGEPAAAIAAVEPGSGRVLALASETGKPYAESPFNLATQARRQPGSTFKTFVLAAAVRAGLGTDAVFDGNALTLPDGSTIGNYDGLQWGPVTLKKATAESINTAFVRAAMASGLDRTVETAGLMGVTTPLDPYPATAIGGLREGVSPLEMAAAYATLPSGGEWRPPRTVLSVERDGRVLEPESPPDPRRALAPEQAAAVTDALRGVVTEGTASRFHALDRELGFPTAGKTGTTENYADAWFVGYDLPGRGGPGLSAAAWIGYPDAARPMQDVAGVPGGVGGETLPLDAWARFVRLASAAEGGS